MGDTDDSLSQLLKTAISDIMPQKDLIIDAVNEMVKDEIKRYIRQKLDEDPELKKEIKEAMYEYMTAKFREINATLKLAKAGAKLGISLIPEDLREEVSKDIVNLLEKEMGGILDRGL